MFLTLGKDRFLAFSKASNSRLVLCYHASLHRGLSCFAFTNVDPCDYISSTQIIQGNFSLHLKASWLATLFPPVTLIPSFPVMQRTGSGDHNMDISGGLLFCLPQRGT